MRPRSIVLFERIYWLHTLFAALWLGWFYLGEGRIGTTLRTDTSEGSRNLLSLISGGLSLVSIGLALLLCFFIARRGSTVAKWIFVFFFALAVLGMAVNVSVYLRGLGSVITLGAAAFSVALRMLCLYLLFRPEANAWFRGRYSPGELLETFS